MARSLNDDVPQAVVNKEVVVAKADTSDVAELKAVADKNDDAAKPDEELAKPKDVAIDDAIDERLVYIFFMRGRGGGKCSKDVYKFIQIKYSRASRSKKKFPSKLKNVKFANCSDLFSKFCQFYLNELFLLTFSVMMVFGMTSLKQTACF